MNTSKKNIIRVFLFILSLIYQLIVLSDVINRTVNNFSLIWWIISLIILYIAFPFRQKGVVLVNRKESTKPDIYPFVFIVIFFALVVRVTLMLNTEAFHIDEYLSSHFSYFLPDISKLDWFGVYPPKGVWVSQFPLPYFLLQKIFFNIFGLSTITMRLSIIPYIVIVFLLLYLIAKELFNKDTAIVAIILLALFSPDLYLSRWSLHFVSSTTVFLAATYFFILSIKLGKKAHFALTGFFLGLCYFTYYSSYVAAPLLLLYALVLILKKQIKMPALFNFLLAIGIFIYTISPLIIYALKVDNFFTQRTVQVKLINGEWSPYQNIDINPKSVLEILEKQTLLSIKSLYTDGVGGHAGYWFGKLALFDPITFVFLVLSILYFLYRIITKGDTGKIFLLMSIFTAFVTGMVFTFPPPAFHRTSLVFPFITLIIAVTINNIYKFLKKGGRKEASILLILCILAIMVGNVIHFKKILATDGPDDPDFPQIEKALYENNQRFVYIAAFHSYSLGKVLFIRSEGKITSVTQPLEEMLKAIPKNKPSFLVILYPDDESIQKVKDVFPHTQVINRLRTHLLVKVG